MGCDAGRCNKTSTLLGIFIMILSLEGWPTKAKEAPSPHEVRLTPLDTHPVFQLSISMPLYKRQHHKMVKHTQTIR